MIIAGLMVYAFAFLIELRLSKVANIERLQGDAPFEADYPMSRDFRSQRLTSNLRMRLSEPQLVEYFRGTVVRELNLALEDPQELRYVRARLRWLFAAREAGRVKLEISYGPPPGHAGAIACSAVENGQRYIVFIGSAVLGLHDVLKSAAFHDHLVAAAVHETLHPTELLARGEVARTERAADEAKVWATMIREVIRPWYAVGRHPGSMGWKLAKCFRDKCQDREDHPAWLALWNNLILGD